MASHRGRTVPAGVHSANVLIRHELRCSTRLDGCSSGASQTGWSVRNRDRLVLSDPHLALPGAAPHPVDPPRGQAPETSPDPFVGTGSRNASRGAKTQLGAQSFVEETRSEAALAPAQQYAETPAHDARQVVV